MIAALTLDVLKGTTRAFDANIHQVRPHKGQNTVAARLRALLHSDLNRSEIAGTGGVEQYNADIISNSPL